MKSLLAILFSVLFFLPSAKGQNGEIYGTVYLNDQVAAGIIVKVTIGNKILAKTITNSDGEYKVYVEGGKVYSICFKAKGYTSRIVNNINLPIEGSVKIVKKIAKKRRKVRFIYGQFDRHK